MSVTYTAFVVREGEEYVVVFPDIPGCLTLIDSLDEAQEAAAEALPSHLEALREEGLEIPPATPVEAFRLDDEECAAVVEVIQVEIEI